MFSKALFKQSMKANGLLWAIITFATCFMLACVMIISGNGNIGKLSTGMSHAIVEDTLDATIEEQSITSYITVSTALQQFDTFYMQAKTAGQPDEICYATALTNLQSYVQTLITAQGYDADSAQAQEISQMIFVTLNPLTAEGSGQFDMVYLALGEEAPRYDLTHITTEQSSYIASYVSKNVSILLAGNMVSDANIQAILDSVQDYGITLDVYQNFTYEKEVDGQIQNVSKYTGQTGYEYIQYSAHSSIVTFQARLDFEVSQGVEQTTAIENITKDMTKTFLSTLPSDLASSLQEVGKLDIYSMIVGTIFFNIAGLLLPMIFMIMVTNNLIAGQVDRGSMAYILSTSIKRRQVVFTQALYLFTSLFAMFACTCVTSLISFMFVDSSTTILTYQHLLLLNLGAFIAMFAMSGISFFASCYFNLSKHSLAVGGGLNIFFLVATILGLFGSTAMPSIVRLDSLNFFNYVSIITLFDVTDILNNQLSFLWKLGILVVFGLVLYILGWKKFEKKDLPL